MERRTSREFIIVEVDSVLVEEILRLHLEEERHRGRSFSFGVRSIQLNLMIFSAALH